MSAAAATNGRRKKEGLTKIEFWLEIPPTFTSTLSSLAAHSAAAARWWAVVQMGLKWCAEAGSIAAIIMTDRELLVIDMKRWRTCN